MIEGDAVVISVPVGVLKAGGIAFEPPLPDWKQQAMSVIGMGKLDKVRCCAAAKVGLQRLRCCRGWATDKIILCYLFAQSVQRARGHAELMYRLCTQVAYPTVH